MSEHVDQRTIPGGYVMAKAMHVTALAECTRRYGALAKTKMVPGIVFEIVKEVNRCNGRSTSHVVADFYFGGAVIKRCKLTTRKVLSSERSDTHAELQEMIRNRDCLEAQLDAEEEAQSEVQPPHSQEYRPGPPPAAAAPGPPPPAPIVVADVVLAAEEDEATGEAEDKNPLIPSVTVHDTA